MRKLALILSAPGSPRPVVGNGFWKLSDQLVRAAAEISREMGYSIA